jgi:hypothetical protein
MKKIAISLRDQDYKKLLLVKRNFEEEIEERISIEEYLSLVIKNTIIEELEGEIDISIYDPEQSNLTDWQKILK